MANRIYWRKPAFGNAKQLTLKSISQKPFQSGDVAKLADALDLGSSGATHAGSIPVIPTLRESRQENSCLLSSFRLEPLPVAAKRRRIFLVKAIR